MGNVFQQTAYSARGTKETDARNARFYHQYQFPWKPSYWERFDDPGLFKSMICQELGDWKREAFPASQPLRIWVAGCGTNQAVITSLQFPEAEVLGTDLSENSLHTSAENARLLGLENITFLRKSINDVEFDSQFDYIICTGVVHHNADPTFTLGKVGKALKPEGMLELMVYNQYHSVFVTGFQKAFQQLVAAAMFPEAEEIGMSRILLNELRLSRVSAGPMSAPVNTSSDAQLADLLLQPVWHSYDVGELSTLCRASGLQMVAPCQNHFDQSAKVMTWDMSFRSTALQKALNTLPDEERWQVTNHLLQENSPMLWFYVIRADNPKPRKTQLKIVEEFMEQKAKRVRRKKEIWGPRAGGGLEKKQTLDFPGQPQDIIARQFLNHQVDGDKIDVVLDRARIPRDFSVVNRLRLLLTTRINPHLELV